jgi:hypothetical protein
MVEMEVSTEQLRLMIAGDLTAAAELSDATGFGANLLLRN